ncbi:hypothetical protein LLS1_04800 [Leifsonia sp. LS1]|uniref:DUF6365 family protein n=1 Tax=Leifsonia sp. LS1 TaxID=2828483 RepID=UPI001CFCE9BB|nr:DUF6365 family protein [Leifsonia sp. LS1]GIT78811.1 hypothetical protein LLS1_04800 [Leifsonia sp. LS1]
MKLEGRTVVFVCPSRFSMGELHNAVQMGRQLHRDLGCCAVYIVPPVFEGLAAAAGFPEYVFPRRSADNRRWLGDLLRLIAPGLLVLADHANPALERSSIDYESVYDAGFPVVAIDSLQFASGREVEYAVAGVHGAHRLRHWLPPSVAVPAVPDGVPVLTPVPVASARHAQNPFALYAERPRAEVAATQLRERLGVPGDHRLVVIAQSGWASAAFAQLARGAERHGIYERLRTRRLVRALDESGHRVTLLEIASGDRADESSARVDVRSLGRLNSQQFTDVIAAADLYATDNLISGAMAQAAALGTPVLALTNSVEREADPTDEIDQELEHRYPGWAFPYLVNPFGWHRELAPVLRDNPYLESVARVEVFERNRLASAFEAQLGANPDRRATAALGESASALPLVSSMLSTLTENLDGAPATAPMDRRNHEMENQ